MKRAALLVMGLLVVGILACNGAPETTPTTQPAAREATNTPGPPTPVPTPSPIPSPTPQPAPTESATGLSIGNPVPLGQALIASNGALITIHGVSKRGLEATQLTKQWNQFNHDPREGMEYVIISGSVGYEGNGEETLEVIPYLDFRIVVNGNILDHSNICCEEDQLQGEMFPGGLIEGPLVFEVPVGGTDMVIIYTVRLEQSYYFATE